MIAASFSLRFHSSFGVPWTHKHTVSKSAAIFPHLCIFYHFSTNKSSWAFWAAFLLAMDSSSRPASCKMFSCSLTFLKYAGVAKKLCDFLCTSLIYSISARTPSILWPPCFPKLWKRQPNFRNAAQGIQDLKHIYIYYIYIYIIYCIFHQFPWLVLTPPHPPTSVPRHPSLQRSCPAQLEAHHSLGQWSAMPWNEQLSICIPTNSFMFLSLSEHDTLIGCDQGFFSLLKDVRDYCSVFNTSSISVSRHMDGGWVLQLLSCSLKLVL